MKRRVVVDPNIIASVLLGGLSRQGIKSPEHFKSQYPQKLASKARC